jgi:hypothetical protein
MTMPESVTKSQNPIPEIHRWELLRDLGVFQLKLAVDALRDLIISPISISAGCIDLIVGPKKSQHFFYRSLEAGRQTENWINLFGEADRLNPEKNMAEDYCGPIDHLVRQIETVVVEQYQKGDLNQKTKAALDKVLHKIKRKSKED